MHALTHHRAAEDCEVLCHRSPRCNTQSTGISKYIWMPIVASACHMEVENKTCPVFRLLAMLVARLRNKQCGCLLGELPECRAFTQNKP